MYVYTHTNTYIHMHMYLFTFTSIYLVGTGVKPVGTLHVYSPLVPAGP